MSSNKLERESSLDVNDMNQLTSDELLPEYNSKEESDDDANFEDLPPGRMHATRSTTDIRLVGSKSNITMSLPNFSVMGGNAGDSSVSSQGSGSQGGGGRRTNKSSSALDYPHSPRSKSPSLSLRAGTAATADGNSSISSLDDVDSDILYDRAGFIDSDVLSTSSADKRKTRQASSGNLPSVNERLSEDTLEDVHAFSDVKVTTPSHNVNSGGTPSRTNSVCTADIDKLQLDPLMEEGDEDAESLDDPSESTDMPPVILTNIENLSLQYDSNRSGHNIAGDITASSSQNARYEVEGDTTTTSEQQQQQA